MKKKFLSIFTLLLMVTLPLTGCGDKDIESTTESTETSETTDLTIESTEQLTTEELTIPDSETLESSDPNDKYKDNPAYQVAVEFITCLQNQDFDKIIDSIALFNNSVIADEHIIEILKTSEWSDIIGTHDQYFFISFDQRYETRKYLTFKMNQIQYNIPLVMDHDNVWRVSLVDYIVENFQFVAPWEVTVYWDGQELDRTKYSTVISNGNTLLDLYTVTCTPVKVQFKFVSTTYGDFIREITPKYISEPYELDRNFNDQQEREVLVGIQTMWNEMFSDYVRGMPAKEWCYKHFAYITTEEQEMAVYNQVKDYLGDNKYISIEMIDIQPWGDNFGGISMNKVATANFSYKLKMVIQPPDKEVEKTLEDGTIVKETVTPDPVTKVTEEIFSNIRVEKAAHGYIIFELTDPDLFNDNNITIES